MHLVFWSTVPLIALLISAAVGAWALLRNPRNPVNAAFGLWMAFYGIWNLGAIGGLASAGAEAALFWSMVRYVGVFLLPPAYAHFTFRLVGKRFNRALLFLPFALFSILLPTGLFVQSVTHDSWHYAEAKGPLYPLFGITTLALVSYALCVLLKARKDVPGRAAKDKLALLALPLLIPYVGVLGALLRFLGEFLDITLNVLSLAMALVIAYALILKK